MTDYGRSRKRNPDRRIGRTILYLLSVLFLCAVILFLLGEIFPEVKEKETALLERTAEILPFRNRESAPEGLPSKDSPGQKEKPEAVANAAAFPDAEEEETEPSGQQVIGVAVSPGSSVKEENALSSETAPEETPEETPEPLKPVTLLFAGDILFDPHYAIMASMLERSPGRIPDITTAFPEETLSVMRGADLFMLNNEFPYSDRGTPTPEKQYTFRASPAYATLLSDMGADLVALANNHLFDHGETAFLDTLDTLDAIGMPHVGAGRNIEEASAPYYYKNGAITVGIVSATQIERMANPDTRGATETASGVFRCMNSERLETVIREMKEHCDFVVAYLHWGTESTEKVDDWQRNLAASCAEAGADLLIGDHPHVLQGIDQVKGVPVIYSLGNFLFNSKAQDTCLLEAVLDPETAELTSLRFIPCRQEGCRTRILTGGEAARVIAYMRTQSGAAIADDGTVTF